VDLTVSEPAEPAPLIQIAARNSRVRVKANRWDHWFKRPDKPHRVGGDVPARGYVLCLTPRSGSTWLAALATKTGVLGLPREYFNPDTPLEDSGASDRAEYLDDVLRAAATPNGVYGVKADFDQLATFIVGSPVLRLPRPETSYVYLTREDVVLQSISYQKAAQSGVWNSRRTAREYRLDRDATWHHVRRLTAMMRAWELAFATFGLSPLRITYEQLEKDPVEVLQRIATSVGVELDPAVLSLEVATQRQRTADDERVRDEFVRANLEELAAVGALTDISVIDRSTSAASDAASDSGLDDEHESSASGLDETPAAQSRNETFAAENKRLAEQNIALSAEVTTLRRRLEAVTQSTSWRSTAPLRKAGEAVRRIRN
jgi:LPS sulfotransferase NodH